MISRYIHEDENTNAQPFTTYCCGWKKEDEKYRWGRQKFVSSNMLWKLFSLLTLGL